MYFALAFKRVHKYSAPTQLKFSSYTYDYTPPGSDKVLLAAVQVRCQRSEWLCSVTGGFCHLVRRWGKGGGPCNGRRGHPGRVRVKDHHCHHRHLLGESCHQTTKRGSGGGGVWSQHSAETNLHTVLRCQNLSRCTQGDTPPLHTTHNILCIHVSSWCSVALHSCTCRSRSPPCVPPRAQQPLRPPTCSWLLSSPHSQRCSSLNHCKEGAFS